MISFYMLTPAKATTITATTTIPSGKNTFKFRFLPNALGDAGLDLPM